MKNRILALSLALVFTTPFVRAVESPHSSQAGHHQSINDLVAQIQANPSNASALVVQALAARGSDDSAILKAAFAALPDQALAIMSAVITSSPGIAPLATHLAVLQLTKGAAADAGAAIAANVTKVAIDAAMPTQNSSSAKAKLAAAIAGAAVRALPGAADLVESTAALAAPSASSRIHQSVRAALRFIANHPPFVVSPSS